MSSKPAGDSMRGQLFEALIIPLLVVALFMYPAYLAERFINQLSLFNSIIHSSFAAEDEANRILLGNCTKITHIAEIESCSGYCVPRIGLVNGSPKLILIGKPK